MPRNHVPYDHKVGEQAKRKARSRRRHTTRRVGMALAVGAFLITSVGAITASPLLRVRHVEISGLASAAVNELDATREAVRVDPNTPIVRAPLADIERAVSELPWVRKVQVSWNVLGTIHVKIEPRIAIAVVTFPNGENWEVDSAGTAIRSASGEAVLPRVEANMDANVVPGMPIMADEVSYTVKTLSECGGESGVQISNVMIDPQGCMWFNMRDGLKVELGGAVDLDEKVNLLKRIYSQEPGIAGRVTSINLQSVEEPACLPRFTSPNKQERSSKSDPPI